MGELTETLRQIAPNLSTEIGGRLQGLTGAILHSYLPQSWALKSPSDAATLSVSAGGTVTVRDGVDPAADVVIRGAQERLLAALRKGRGAGLRRTDFEVELRTRKGRTAFEFLRGRFGL
ncbi:MAG: hypothetical protein M1606_03990 [Candidatus Thermoplasmatota archaeon]|jgi:hypothetical protein|nr:hypothetical protein [Candidatus Thermoplasmatota archaeon]MCL5983808.1 hypothetical protein [Candidatus Thermoplasmatota archaeon]